MLNLFIRTFGCQMNKHDSDRMLWLLKDKYTLSNSVESADLIIINSCCVRSKAEEKLYSYIGRLKELKIKKPELMIALAGCVAQNEGKELYDRFPQIDIVIGTDKIHELPRLIDSRRNLNGRSCDVGKLNKNFQFVNRVDYKKQYKVAEFVTIMNGCNNFCSYCIVPYVRGPEKSRNPEEIINEIKTLASNGTREVTLLGQNVNSFHYGENGNLMNFADLLVKINEIEDILRIRFVTSHPKDISDDVIKLFGKLNKLCEHIHLPIQSGSNRILKMMNRKYSREHYIEIVNKLKEACPAISISTDLIVGFPTEGSHDFDQTIKLVEEVGFDTFFSFIYSPRNGTEAANLDDNIPISEKRQRLAILQKLGDTIADRKNREFEGKFDYVLFEAASKKDKSKLTGRLRSNRIVNMNADRKLIGKEIKIKITRANKHFLDGDLDS